MNPSGSALDFSTYLGGASNDVGRGIAVDAEGSAYLTGTTGSSNFPSVNPIKSPPNNGSTDAFILKITNPTPLLSISGQVKNNGNGLAGVTLTLSGSKSATTQTDSQGNYRFDGLEVGGSYMVTASKQNYHVYQTSQTFNNMAQNETANFDTIAITVAFISTGYIVTESQHYAQISVQLLPGYQSVPVSVDYTMSDGTAHERTDYTRSSGTINFAPGETIKSFNVIVTDNAFSDGERSVNLALSNPNGAFLSTPSTAVLNISDNSDPQTRTTNPIDDPQAFVRQQYADFLNRVPDDGGLGYWTGEITRCGSDPQCIHDRRVGVADAFFFEDEFQKGGGYVYRVYGAALDQSKTAFALNFVRRSGFLAQYPETLTAAQFVDEMLTVARNYSGVALSSERAAILMQVADSQAFVDAVKPNSRERHARGCSALYLLALTNLYNLLTNSLHLPS